MTYLVMECHPAYAVVLDQAGRMLRVANMGYEEGQKVDHVVEQQVQAAPVRKRWASIAIAACLCATVLGSGSYGAFFVPYGSVRLKINPDVLMSVSYMDRVVGLEGLNEDGDRLIDNVHYKGEKAEKVTSVLVERAVEMGYLSDGGTVTVKADAGSSQWKQRRESNIGSEIQRQFEGRMAVEIKTGENEGAADENDTDKESAAGAPAGSPAAQPVSGKSPSMSNEPDKKGMPGRESGVVPGDDDDDDRDDDDRDDDDRDDDDRDDDDRDDDDRDDNDRDDDDRDDDDRDDDDRDNDDRDDDDNNDGSDRDDGNPSGAAGPGVNGIQNKLEFQDRDEEQDADKEQDDDEDDDEDNDEEREEDGEDQEENGPDDEDDDGQEDDDD